MRVGTRSVLPEIVAGRLVTRCTTVSFTGVTSIRVAGTRVANLLSTAGVDNGRFVIKGNIARSRLIVCASSAGCRCVRSADDKATSKSKSDVAKKLHVEMPGKPLSLSSGPNANVCVASSPLILQRNVETSKVTRFGSSICVANTKSALCTGSV